MISSVLGRALPVGGVEARRRGAEGRGRPVLGTKREKHALKTNSGETPTPHTGYGTAVALAFIVVALSEKYESLRFTVEIKSK